MNRMAWWLAIGLTLAALVGSISVYPRLPDQIPTHWNIRGEVDGYGSKTWAAFLMPGVMGTMVLLFALFPFLSPKQFQVTGFRPTYLFLLVLTVALFGYMHALMLMEALGLGLGFNRALFAGLFLFFALFGNVLGKVQRNFWIGIRVPWTLASERVWNDTHRMAAWLWVAGGLIGFVLCLAGQILAAMILLIALAVIPIVYSLVHYKHLERRGEV